MFVQGGMSNFEALRSGTLHGATYIGLDDELFYVAALLHDAGLIEAVDR